MSGIFEDLYFGRIIPWERKVPHTREFMDLHRKIEAEEKYFVGKMSLDDCQRFEAFKNLMSQTFSHEEIDIFTCGFKLGAALMAEVYAGQSIKYPGQEEEN